MECPASVRRAVEMRAAAWQPSVLKNTSADITRRYKSADKTGSRLIASDVDALVYSIVRMPATFAAVGAALGYALETADIMPQTMLDIGSGTGAAVWAAHELCDIKNAVCLEREGAMHRLGQELMSQCGLSGAVWEDADITTDTKNRSAQLVCESYMLNELSPALREEVINKLWDSTQEILLLVEPGTPEGFDVLRQARSQLLEAGAHIAAPCPHEDICRISKGDWCHFTARVARSRLHKLIKGGDVPYEDEKFAYLALSRKDVMHGGARVLRHPVTAKGRVTLSLCEKDENREVTITKSSPLYKSARKAQCGDMIGR